MVRGARVGTPNVMAGLSARSRPARKSSPAARKARALADPEIVAVWNACEGRGAFGNIIRLPLLWDWARREIAKLERDRVLSDRLRLPPLHTKMGEQHEVPLTDLMRTVMASQPKTTSKIVFPKEKPVRDIGWTS